MPSSSNVTSARAPPKKAPRTPRSQALYGPPRITRMPESAIEPSSVRSQSSGSRRDSLQCTSCCGRGRRQSERWRRRHGVSPCRRRPKSREAGCARCSSAVSATSGQRRPRSSRGSGARSALQRAWTTGGRAESASSGAAHSSGGHALPSAQSSASETSRRYHSGMSGSDASAPGTGGSSDWNGALPHVPW